VRLLQGEPANTIPIRTLGPATPIFDARELRRWAIPNSRLEPGSVIRFGESTTWPAYRGAFVVALLVVGTQTALVIVFAVSNAKRRQSAPDDVAVLRAAEASLSALSQRLMEAREHERASIARTITDDVGQQLAALTLRLHALGIETEGRAGKLRWRIEELCAQFWELEREILAISDPLYHRLAFLGLADSVRAFSEHRCAEGGVALDLRTDGIPEQLPEPIALALFRVLEETVDNAIRHGRPSRVSVSLSAANGAIHLAVSDDGSGFDAEAAMRRGALGLIAMRERMHLVGGTWRIDSSRGAGTRVEAGAPLAPVEVRGSIASSGGTRGLAPAGL
jgi:signal transduction histidine kinase